MLFVRWKQDRLDAVRRWIATFAAQWITSAQRQFQEAHHFRQTGEMGRVFGGLFFSARGYEALGFKGVQLPGDQPFRMGMQHDELAAALGDPPVSDWETGYQQGCDGMVLLGKLWITRPIHATMAL
jgi:deferrochelatase/peroxidase EfeB